MATVKRTPKSPAPNPQLPPPAARGGLGRGLGALIPRGPGSPGGLQEIDVARIAPNPRQPRLHVDRAALAELADSIRRHGLLQPIVVTRLEADGEGYLLIAGERRWRAAQLAGLSTVPAIVKEAASLERLELALVENIQREDLTPLELAAAYRALMDEHRLTQEQVAQRVGKSRAAVANTLGLLQLPRPAREALAGGRISEGHARALRGLRGEAALLATLDDVLARGLTVRETEALVRRLTTEGEPDPPVGAQFIAPASDESPDPEIGYLEERFRQALGTRVQLVRARRGGRLVIHFYSNDELEGLYQRICGD